nr:hypothetical protein [Lachnospiraceae bacterium]
MRIVYFDICAIVLSVTVLVFLLVKHYTKDRTNRLIITLSALIIAAAGMDLFDSMFGTYIPQSPSNAGIQLVSNTIFYIIRHLTTPAYILFLFSFMGIWHKLKQQKIFALWIMVPAVGIILSIIWNIFSGKIFYISGDGVYTRGGYIGIIYFLSAFHLLLILYMVIKFRCTVRKSEMFMIFAFAPLNILAIFVQRIFIGLRLETLAMALTLFLIATVIQRPEEMVDSIVGTLSQNAYLKDMYKSYSVGRPMNAVLVKIRNYQALRTNLGPEIYGTTLKRVSDKLRQMGRIINLYTDVYYVERGVYAIIADGDKFDKMQDLGRLIVAYLKESFTLGNLEIRLNSTVCLCRLPEDLASYNTLINFTSSFYRTLPEADKLILLSDIMNSKDFMM